MLTERVVSLDGKPTRIVVLAPTFVVRDSGQVEACLHEAYEEDMQALIAKYGGERLIIYHGTESVYDSRA